MSAAAPEAIHWDPVRFSMPDGAAHHQDDRAREAHAVTYGEARPLPEADQWAGAVARTAVEVLLGIRPVVQLNRWLSAPVYVALARRAGLAVRVLGSHRSRSVLVRNVTVSRVNDYAVEAAVTLHDGRRARAAALRLELFRGRWLTTALEIG